MATLLLAPDRNNGSGLFSLMGVCGPGLIKRVLRPMLNTVYAISTVRTLITDSSHLWKRARRDPKGHFMGVWSLDHTLASSICYQLLVGCIGINRSSLCLGNIIGGGECGVNIPSLHCNIYCGCVMLDNGMGNYLYDPALKRIPVAASPVA